MSSNNPEKKNLTILGAGATGLAAAYFAARAGWNVTVVDGSPRAGGLLATFPTKGDPLEYFYHHFFTHDAEIRWFLDEIGLSSEIVFRETVMGVFRDQKIYNFTTPADLLRFSPLSIIDKLRFGVTSLALSRRGSWRDFEQTSALDWFSTWAGKGATETIWRPMLEIKFGRFASDVPLAWMIGRLQQRLKSREGGKELLGYLSGSLQQLVDRLMSKLAQLNVKVILGDPAQQISVSGERAERVKLRSGTELSADCLLATIPNPQISLLLQESKFQDYRQFLDRTQYFGAICALVFSKRPLSHVYWLNVADPGFPFGGVIEHTNFVSPERYGGQHITYLSRYVERDNPLLLQDTATLAEQWVGHLPKIYPNLDKNDIEEVKVFRTNTAAIVCGRGASALVPNFRSPIEGLFIANMSHVYPDERSVNNCIKIASRAAGNLGIPVAVPPGRSLAAQVGI